MKLVEILLDTAAADIELLQKNLDHGDVPGLPRDLDFALYAKTEERAKLICDFVTDNHYGRPRYEQVRTGDGPVRWRLLIVINSPATEQVVCTLSAFMTCLAELYDLDYDGWGCPIRRA